MIKNIVIIDCCNEDDFALLLSRKLCCNFIRCRWEIFNDGEILLKQLDFDIIMNSKIIVCQSLHCPNDIFLKLLILLKTIKKYAKKIYLLSPYFGYMRQHDNIVVEMFLEIFFSLGVKKIITLDPHSNIFLEEKYKNKIIVIKSQDIFIEQIENIINVERIKDFCFVSPDEGSNVRNRNYAEHFKTHCVFAKKIRKNNLINISLEDKINYKNIFVVDDIVDTGGTLNCLIVKILEQNSKANIYVFCTHGLFSCFPQFLKLKNVKILFVTNSLPIKIKNKKINIYYLIDKIFIYLKIWLNINLLKNK